MGRSLRAGNAVHDAMKAAKDEFALRYFAWALEQARYEAEQDFPNLRIIEHPAVYCLLEFCETKSIADRVTLLHSLVRAAHEYAMTLKGDSLSKSELALLREYQGKDYGRGKIGMITGLGSRKYPELVRRYLSDKRRPEQVIASLAAAFPKKDRVYEKDGNLQISQKISGWFVTTSFGSSAGAIKLRFGHEISVFPNGEGHVHYCLGRKIMPSHGISIIDWLGISADTEWHCLPPGSLEDLGLKIAKIAKNFLSAAPQLLEGIKAPEMAPELASIPLFEQEQSRRSSRGEGKGSHRDSRPQKIVRKALGELRRHKKSNPASPLGKLVSHFDTMETGLAKIQDLDL